MERTPIFLILDADPEVTAALALALRRPGRHIVTCHDAEAAEILLERLPIAVAISAARLGSPFGFEGLDFVRFVRNRAPGAAVFVMSGSGERAVEREALRRGATAILRKPVAARSLERALAEVS
ncbi:MAG: response regulator [Thermoanaerobaculia bacterium]